MFVDFRGDFDRLSPKQQVIRMLEDEFGSGRHYDEFAQDIVDVFDLNGEANATD